MKLTIDRARWIRGGNGDGPEERSCLYRPHDGHMCCLGFFARACGIDKDQIEDEAEPEDVPRAGWPEWVLRAPDDFAGDYGSADAIKNSADIVEIIKVNDDDRLGAAAREAKLAALFARHGIEVEFK